MCLHHLDEPSFVTAVTAMQTKIERFSLGALSLNLMVPVLATTVNQQVNSTHSNDTATTVHTSQLLDYSSLAESQETETNASDAINCIAQNNHFCKL